MGNSGGNPGGHEWVHVFVEDRAHLREVSVYFKEKNVTFSSFMLFIQVLHSFIPNTGNGFIRFFLLYKYWFLPGSKQVRCWKKGEGDLPF